MTTASTEIDQAKADAFAKRLVTGKWTGWSVMSRPLSTTASSSQPSGKPSTRMSCAPPSPWIAKVQSWFTWPVPRPAGTPTNPNGIVKSWRSSGRNGTSTPPSTAIVPVDVAPVVVRSTTCS